VTSRRSAVLRPAKPISSWSATGGQRSRGGGNTGYQVHVEQSQAHRTIPVPFIDVPFGKVVNGTTASANDDFIRRTTACFAGLGRAPTDRSVATCLQLHGPAAGFPLIRQIPVEVNTPTTVRTHAIR
jgi:hypothetical protein